VEGTAHSAFLDAFFADATRVPFASRERALEALRAGEVDALFADAVSLSNWLNGEPSGGCCRFLDGAYTSTSYFGEGIGIAVPKGREMLRVALNYALARIYERGLFEEYYLRYFPLGLY